MNNKKSKTNSKPSSIDSLDGKTKCPTPSKMPSTPSRRLFKNLPKRRIKLVSGNDFSKGVTIMAAKKYIESPRFKLVGEDLSRALQGAAKFLVPALTVLVADLTNALPSWVDAKYVAITIWALNAVWGVFLKWVESNSYVQK